MKFKFSTISISLLLAGLLVYGFISLNSDDPYADYGPGTETGIITTNGNVADTTTPANWPYITAWNFYHSPQYPGTVGASWFEGKYYNNRWSTSFPVWYRYLPNGPGGGPGDDDTISNSTGTRDMTVAPDGSGTSFLWGGTGSTLLRKFDKDGITKGTYVISGANFRAIAWDKNRKGFWNCSWDTPIKCQDTTGALKGPTFPNSSAINDKYGLAFDSCSSPDSAFIWVWHQQTTTSNRLTKIHLGSMTIVATYNFPHAVNIGIAGGAEAFEKDGKYLLALNYQGYAIVAYKLADLAPGVFCDDFETYTVNQRLACQDSINWTTWSHDPCNTTEDPLISNAQAFSPTKSVVIAYNNDLVKELGNDTTGIKLMTFKFYVPTGKTGYWNTLAGFMPSFPNKWGMECYFDLAATGNNGRLFAGSSTAFPFAYTHGAWQTAMLVVNLDVDSAKFYMNGTHIRTWRWTAGANGSAVPKRLAGNNFYGALSSNEMYVDNYCYDPDASWIITGVTQNGNTVPTEYSLSQNYPNPFNPSTKINFAIPTTGLVTMKIYDVLGKEVATLVNETKVAGTYSVNFDGTNLSSGVYFYRIEANDFVAVKRMMLIK